MKDCLLFFVKYPEPGEVKTRLAEGSSHEQAATFYRTFVEEKLAELDDCSAEVIICFTPETARNDMQQWLGTKHRFIGQKGADLGRRMENAFREAFFMGYERVVLSGSDIPALSPAIVEEGLAALTPGTACLGPADDGGYYLIGFHRQGLQPTIFQGMEWSTDMVFQQTVTRLEDAGVDFHELPQLEDTDTIEDVETLAALGPTGPLGPRSLAMARKLSGM